MIKLIGIIIILAAVAIFVLSKVKKDLKILPNWASTIIAIVGLLITSLFYAEPGHSYKVYYPWGGSKIVTSTGLNTTWLGQVISFQNEISIRYCLLDSTGELPKLPKKIYALAAHEWEFADAVKAHIGSSVVLGINPQDTKLFSEMVDNAQSEENLVYSRLIPDINTAIKNTCKLMLAQGYISGEAANYDRFFKDQLENGSYELEEYYEATDDFIVGDTSRSVKVSSDGNSGRKGGKRYRIIIDPKTGEPKREKGATSLALYHITVKQAVSDNISWESAFNTRLGKQKDLVAQTQLEKQGVEKAIWNQKKLYQEGEASKTEKKASLEKDQIEQTITAQTKSKVAEFKVQEEKNLLAAAQTSSQRIRVQADANSYNNTKMVQAGLTPQEKQEFENKRVIGVAAELSKITFPAMYVNNSGNAGGKGGADGLLSQLIGAQLWQQMFNNQPKKE
jgi:hypothetical protein